MEWWRPDLLLPVLGAILAGAAVGYEREYRARAAGFRTHTMVALASAVLMLAAQHQVEWAGSTTPEEIMRVDPVRMAHGILTGIGFLCGGVIFKDGLSVHGLTTAASLWTTSALGILFGVGFYGLAIGATVATVLVLAGFKWVETHAGGQALADATFRFRAERAPNETELRTLLEGQGAQLSNLAHRLVDDGQVIEYGATLKTRGRLRSGDLVDVLRADPRLVGYAITPRNT
jgi:putative Mg2+ transporter-C (MgtC) family protein